MDKAPWRRVLIFGSSGSGKSSLASLIGQKLSLPVFHLDKYFWSPGWVERPRQEMILDVDAVLKENNSFVMDGNYKRVLMEKRIERADLILVLDFSRFVCLYRAFKRSFKHYGQTRPSMQDGCREKLFPSWEFMKYIWNYRKRTLLPIEGVLKNYPHKQIIRFKDQASVDRWLGDNIL